MDFNELVNQVNAVGKSVGTTNNALTSLTILGQGLFVMLGLIVGGTFWLCMRRSS